MAPKKKQAPLPGQRRIDTFFGSNPVSTAARPQQSVSNGARQRPAGVGRNGSTAVPAPLQARLSSTATALTTQLESAVGQIATGQLQAEGRYHLSRTARQAAGVHPQQRQWEEAQQHPQQQRYTEALRAAYLLVARFCSMNDEQRKAATSDITKALLIIAGAGTGKTSTLINRILFLLSQDVPPHSIVVLTFTNNAAEELQTRLHQAMQEARVIAAEAVGASVDEHKEKAHFGGVLACTFHGFCYRLLRRYFRACGFSQCPTVWLDKDARQAIRVAIKLADVDKVRTQLARWLTCADGWAAIQAAATQQHPELMRKWHAEQREERAKEAAAAAKRRQKAANAEAKRHGLSEPKGTKRKAASKQQQQQLSKGQQLLSFGRQSSGKVPKQLGASDVTSSASAAQQQEQQQRISVPQPPHVTQQQTGWHPHPQQQQQQQQHDGEQQDPPQLGQQQQQMPNDEGQEQQDDGSTAEQLGGLKLQQLQVQAKIRLYELLQQHYDTPDGDGQQGEMATSVQALKGKVAMKEIKRVQRAIDSFKCKGERPEQGKVVAQYAFYQMLLKLCNAVDFNDLLGHVADMLQQHKPIQEHVQRLWPYLMVDEYQDCNLQQVLIVRLLQDALQRVTAVGDDAQSIYGFRGAAPNVFPLYQAAFQHDNLVTTLQKNYRSTPQILRVAQSLLTGGGIHPKTLEPQVPAAGKAPVRLLLVDSEEHEAEVIAKEAKRLHVSAHVLYSDMAVLFRAFRCGNGRSHTKLQKALTREEVPFVLVRDVSMFQRKEVLDVLAYITLALKFDDDRAFMRVLNVPPRRLGKKLQDQLQLEQDRLMAAHAEQEQGIAGSGMQQQWQQQEGTSFYSIAKRLLAAGHVATLHERALREFLALLERLYGDVRGQTPAEAVVTVLQQVPGLAEDIRKQRQRNRKQIQGDEAAEEEEGEEEEQEGQAHPADHDTREQQQQQDWDQGRSHADQHQHDTSQAEASEAAGSSAAGAAADNDSDLESDEGSESASEDPGSDGGADVELGTGHMRPKELVTYALGCLYDEAVAFSAKWAVENNGATATDAAAAAGLRDPAAAAAAGDGNAGGGSQPGNASAGEAAVENVGAPSLYELMAAQVTQLWSARQLLRSGLPEFMLVEVYAALGKGSRPLADFHAHVTLNPNTEPAAHSKAAKKQKDHAPADALVISTIHAAKGQEYNTVWVPRWVEGFLPAFPRTSDMEALAPHKRREFEDSFFKEEQRLAHVAVTRPKKRLYLTRPLQQYELRRRVGFDNSQQEHAELLGIADERQPFFRDKWWPSRFLLHLEPLLNDQAVYREINLCKEGGVSDTAWYDV